MENVYLLLGSNLGNREAYLEEARKKIDEEIGTIKRASSLYQTASWGKTDQPDFINQVIELTSSLKPQEVLARAIGIEKELGRFREEKWGSRTIDIDILFYGNKIVKEKNLIIPHPYLHLRRFTLEPLMELVPNLVHPLIGKPINQLLEDLTDNLSVRRLN